MENIKEKKRQTEITERDKQIIKFLSLGYKDDEISAQIKISTEWVRMLLVKLFEKTGTVSRPHLVAWAIRQKIIK